MVIRKLSRLLDRGISFLSFLGGVVAAAALATIAVSVIIEVIARSVFNAPTIWAVEVSTYAIITTGFLGSALVLRRGRHLEINLLTTRLSPTAQKWTGVVTDVFGAAFCFVVCFSGIRFVELSQMMGAVSVSELRVPLWIPQLTIPIGFALLGLEFLSRIMVRLGLVARLNLTEPANSHM
jgi:TRAP-type C4-dicarboxylate transport system permease small subunit